MDQLKAVESIPLQLPHPADSRATRVAKTLFANPGRPKNAGKIVRGLRRQQANDTAPLSGRNQNDFQQVAPAASPASCNAAAGCRGQGDVGGLGSGIQQHERVYIDVSQTAGNNADAVFTGQSRSRSAMLRRREPRTAVTPEWQQTRFTSASLVPSSRRPLWQQQRSTVARCR